MILVKFLKNILEQDQDSKLQELQDFKTIFAAINWLFQIVINLKMLKNSQKDIYIEVICL